MFQENVPSFTKVVVTTCSIRTIIKSLNASAMNDAADAGVWDTKL
jgi:hypothetical protein